MLELSFRRNVEIVRNVLVMSRLFITGDTHGEMSIGRLSHTNWPEGRTLTKDDYVIIAGDFGLLWCGVPDKVEKYWIKWLNEKPWTTLFIDGNHDNHERLNSLENAYRFGSDVGKVSDSVFHLRRGEVYKIAGHRIFTFGGAVSIDKANRKEHLSWWKEEVPSWAECEHGLKNLSEQKDEVDYIITHTCPHDISLILTKYDVKM